MAHTPSAHSTPNLHAANLLGGHWTPIPGNALVSVNPARPAEPVWQGSPSVDHVAQAIDAARRAQPAWAALPIERRAAALRRFAELARAREAGLAALIREEVGKPMWDAKQEASLIAAKVEITLDAAPTGGRTRVTPFEIAISATRRGRCTFRPHGVMGVIGPFNFPAHLPNGHIVPALLMGNTVVFKPSDKAPACGAFLTGLLDEALKQELGGDGLGAHAGIINLVQGGADVAKALASHDGLDAIAFTGSWPVGRAIMAANLDRPGRLLALEMGGNNAAIVMPDADLMTAGIEIVRSAFVTAGQRCTGTRRVIVHRDIAGKFVAALAKAARNLIVGDPRGGGGMPVFMGPVISAAARQAVVQAQHETARDGGEVIVPCVPVEDAGCPGGYFLSPGLTRVGRFMPVAASAEREVFGPHVAVSEADSLENAIEQANATNFGLAASIFTRDDQHIERFVHAARAGCINVNTGTAGASSKLPFGGLGLSGNHRPAGAFALDYCAYPVASMVEQGIGLPAMPEGMRFEPSWLA